MSPRARRVMNFPFVVLIKLYQVTLSPIFGRGCRYTPTCSNYGLDAYRLYGPVRATWLTARRILRCHPFVKGGYDPVPIPDDETSAPAARAGECAEREHRG